MEVVVDTNKVLAAIITSGRVRYLFLRPSLKIYVPRYLMEELESKKEDICRRKVHMSIEIFDYILREIIKPKINIVDEEYYEDQVYKTYNIAKEFDPTDTPFIALALKIGVPIWTNDKDLIVSGLITGEYIAVDTIALERMISGASVDVVIEDLRKRYNVLRLRY